MNRSSPSRLPRAPRTTQQSTDAAPALRHRPRMLLAEDDNDLRFCLSRVFELDGLDVTAVSTGRELLCAIDRAAMGSEICAFDIVVTDVRMPFCNGLTVLSLMENELCHVPCVVVSAFGDEALRAQAHRLGATFVDKPVDVEQLERLVRKALALEDWAPAKKLERV